jgi:inhibitor of cysteine peptidase
MAKRWLKGLLAFSLLLLLVSSLVIPVAASTSPGAPSSAELTSHKDYIQVPVTETANGTTVELNPGDEILISLEVNHSTLYRWHLAGISDSSVLEYVSNEYVPPELPGPGRPGTDIWTFRALKPGLSTLTLEYSAAGNVGRTFTLTARVKANVPASSNTGLWLMIAGLAGLMFILMYKRMQTRAKSW